MAHDTCPVCDEQFIRRRTDQSYCSRKCKTLARGRRQRRDAPATACSVGGCEGRPMAGLRSGWCSMHYQRQRKTGDVGPPSSLRGGRMGIAPCSIEGCARKFYAKGLCSMHYNRNRVSGTPGLPAPLKAAAGEGCYITQDGYRWVVYQAGGTKGHRTKKIAEHRLVMQRVLGRVLEPFESVHHKNGQRADNDPSNLELWTKPQPSGQRPEDLVAWVVAYYPDLTEQMLQARKETS